MKTSNSPRGGSTKTRCILSIAIFLAGLLSSCSAAHEATTGTPGPQTSAEARLYEDWRTSMTQVPLPKKGCFQSSYPSKEWREVQCSRTKVAYPMPPRSGPRPQIVGNRDDLSAHAPFGFISSATGSFDTVSGVTSESGKIANSGPSVANAYTLQLNTNFIRGCAGSPNPDCTAWEQFVYENNPSVSRAFIQYWLIQYNTNCPAGAGWQQQVVKGIPGINCVILNNSLGPVNVTDPQGSMINQPITNLSQLSLNGSVDASGDRLTFFVGTTAFATAGDNPIDLAGGWRTAEFNVFGDGGNSDGGSQANFNTGATIIPRTRISYGGSGTGPPTCRAEGFTAETNNLSFAPTAPSASGPGPALLFSESSAGGLANCAAATTVGDTHLTTFNGLLYDFQASGDFVLAQVDPDFVVQTRQVSGAPTWPDTSVNSAVATQMGKDKVAICLGPRLNVDGATNDLADGKTFSTSDGVDVSRRGNVYFISSQSGDSVRATVNASYIDVNVGIGHWPANLSGLLANPNGNVNQIAARDGTVLTNAFSFKDLYHRFGESWRVSPRESLLSVCGDGKVEVGNPRRPFYARDLEPAVYTRARAVCTTAGVKGEALLDACTLDVAVIGNDAAAKVFVTLPQPIALGNVSGGRGSKYLLWLLLLLMVLIVLLIWWLLRRTRRTT